MGTGSFGRAGETSALADRVRRSGRTPAVALATFLLGVLTAALIVPHHGTAPATSAVALAGSAPSATLSGPGSSVGGTSAIGAGSGPGPANTGSAAAVGSAGSGTPAVGAAPAAGSPAAPALSATGAGAPGGGGGAGGAPSGGKSGAGGAAPATSGKGGPGAVAGASGARPRSAATAGSNGGATAPGVTATSINVGVLGGDSTPLEPACPRCGQGGQATDQALLSGLLAQWHKDGQLPVYGRNLTPIFQEANDVDATGTTSQSACENLVAQHVFVTMTGAGAGGTKCLTQQYHTLTVDGLGGSLVTTLKADAPYMWELGPSLEEVYTAFATWADQQGLLKGQVLGLYAPNDATVSGAQEFLAATFIAQLKKLGYHLAVDYQYTQQGQSDDPVAVERMKTAGVTVMFVMGALTEPSGFQNQAEQLGYNPKYPVADAGTYAFTDALADVEYNANAQNGNYGFGTRWWSWSGRNPATPADNPAAAECLQAYESQTHTNLDVFNDDAKIRYLLDECSDLQVILQAIHNAGPDLTQASFIHGIEQIRNMQTAEYQSETFTSPIGTGSNDWQAALFGKVRWQPSNDYWKMVGPYEPWSYFPQDASTVAAAEAAGQ